MVNLGIFRSKEFLKFLLVGGTAAGVNFLSRILLDILISFSWSIVIAYLLGMTTAFVLNKWLVFEEAGNQTARQVLLFILVNIIAVFQTYIISIGFVYWIFPFLNISWHVRELAHLVGISVPIVTSYIGHKYLTFKPVRPFGSPIATRDEK